MRGVWIVKSMLSGTRPVRFCAAKVRFTIHPKQPGVARIPGGSGQLLVESICFWEVGCRERFGWFKVSRFYCLSSALSLLGHVRPMEYVMQ